MATDKQINFIISLMQDTQKTVQEVAITAGLPMGIGYEPEYLSAGQASKGSDTYLQIKAAMPKAQAKTPVHKPGKATSRQIAFATDLLAKIDDDDYRDLFDDSKPESDELSEMSLTEMSELIDDLQDAI